MNNLRNDHKRQVAPNVLLLQGKETVKMAGGFNNHEMDQWNTVNSESVNAKFNKEKNNRFIVNLNQKKINLKTRYKACKGWRQTRLRSWYSKLVRKHWLRFAELITRMTKLNHSFLSPVIIENGDQHELKKESSNAKTRTPTSSKQWHRTFRSKEDTGFHDHGVTRSHGGKREYLHHIAKIYW